MLNYGNPILYARLSKRLFIAGLCFFTTFCERFLPDYLETTISSYIHIGAFSSLLIGASFALSTLFYGLSKYLQPASLPDVLYFTQEWIVPNFITVDLGLDANRRNYLNNYFRWPSVSLTSKAVFNLRLYPRGIDGLGEEISIHVQSYHRFEDNLQPLDVIFLVYLRDKKGDKCFEKDMKVTFSYEANTIGWKSFCSRSEIIQMKNAILDKKGNLTVGLEMWSRPKNCSNDSYY